MQIKTPSVIRKYVGQNHIVLVCVYLLVALKKK